MKKRKKKSKKSNILLLIFIILFIYSSYNVFMWFKSDINLRKMEDGLYKDVVITKDNEIKGEKKGSISVDFEKLKKINPDIIGWIKIDDTYINYPILQGKTNEYYLKKDIYGSYDFSGSIFVYSNADKNFNDENTVIYGHNMKNQKMFAHLRKIYNEELGKNIDVEIYTEEKNNIYKVFSCYIESPNIEIIQNNFSELDKKNYIDEAIVKSKINFEQKIDYSKKIITLITCSNSNNRVIVHAIEE